MAVSDHGWTRLFLDAAVVAGVLFVAVTMVEIFARPGFSMQKHAISMLSLGERGWVMVAVFILSGALTLVAAYGLSVAGAGGWISGVWGPLLIALYGAGLILAGIFPAPAGMGFPPGTPADMQPVMDLNATLHSVGFMLGFGSLIVACFVFAAHFFGVGAYGWAMISVGVGIALPVSIALGVTNVIAPGIMFYIAAVLAWVWFAALAVEFKPAV